MVSYSHAVCMAGNMVFRAEEFCIQQWEPSRNLKQHSDSVLSALKFQSSVFNEINVVEIDKETAV